MHDRADYRHTFRARFGDHDPCGPPWAREDSMYCQLNPSARRRCEPRYRERRSESMSDQAEFDLRGVPVETGPGWWPLVTRLDHWIRRLLGNGYAIESITERDGHLDFRIAHPEVLDLDLHEAVRILIAHTVSESERACEQCGRPAMHDRDYPFRTRCREHQGS